MTLSDKFDALRRGNTALRRSEPFDGPRRAGWTLDATPDRLVDRIESAPL